jgi:hypothetical protein
MIIYDEERKVVNRKKEVSGIGKKGHMLQAAGKDRCTA